MAFEIIILRSSCIALDRTFMENYVYYIYTATKDGLALDMRQWEMDNDFILSALLKA